LETFARRNLNYLGRMVDTNGLPYFNIFWTDPAEAAHDWPDFGDVMARQYQAAIMARNMTGERAPIEAVWRRSSGDGFLSGFIIKSLVASARVLHDETALKPAGQQVRRVFVESPLFSPDNTFRHGGHMHGNLRTLVGAADYALFSRDPVLFSRVDALYRYVRSEATSFGFMPEVIGRQGDVVATETCALMDYVGLAVTLANHGHPGY